MRLLLIGTLGVAGISLATGLVGWMVYLLHKKLGRKEELAFDERLRQSFQNSGLFLCNGNCSGRLELWIARLFSRCIAHQNSGIAGFIGGGAITCAGGSSQWSS